jgi:hypothetical protein
MSCFVKSFVKPFLCKFSEKWCDEEDTGPPPPTDDAYLKEDGDYLLLENGDKLLLE